MIEVTAPLLILMIGCMVFYLKEARKLSWVGTFLFTVVFLMAVVGMIHALDFMVEMVAFHR